MAKELNSPGLIAKRQEEAKNRALPDPIQDPERVKGLESLKDNPVKYLGELYINQNFQPRDLEMIKLVLLAKISNSLAKISSEMSPEL